MELSDRQRKHLQKLNSNQKGENNRAWKGNKAGYYAIHAWIRNNYGSAIKCVKCYTITAKRYEWANISGKYLRDIKDFEQLCRKCHANSDIKTSKWGNSPIRERQIIIL